MRLLGHLQIALLLNRGLRGTCLPQFSSRVLCAQLIALIKNMEACGLFWHLTCTCWFGWGCGCRHSRRAAKLLCKEYPTSSCCPGLCARIPLRSCAQGVVRHVAQNWEPRKIEMGPSLRHCTPPEPSSALKRVLWIPYSSLLATQKHTWKWSRRRRALHSGSSCSKAKPGGTVHSAAWWHPREQIGKLNWVGFRWLYGRLGAVQGR